MSNISKPNSFSSGTTISSSEVNDNFDTIYNDYNGNISAANLADSAVSTAKIADGAVTAAKLATDIVDTGWAALSGTHSVSTGYNAGNRSFTIATSADHTSTLSPGMRYKLTRGTTPSTQCADFESGSSQYASKSSPSGITFTDDFTCEAWIKLESYTGSLQTIVGRRSTTQGWGFRLSAAGAPEIFGLNTTADIETAYQSVPLNKWVHVAASMDMSGADGKIYIDGVLVPSLFTSGAASSLVQAGNLDIGDRSDNNGDLFDGKISDVRVWSDIRTETEIQDNMYKALVGNETGLVGYWKLNGDFTDETSNSNDLTASGGIVATTADNPFNATEYGVITAVSASTVTVFCPEGYGIPNETLTNPFYSTQSTPFGFPRDNGKWELFFPSGSEAALGTGTSMVNSSNLYSTIPAGAWKLSYKFTADYARNGGSLVNCQGAIGEAISDAGAYPETVSYFEDRDNSAPFNGGGTLTGNAYREFTTSTTVYMLDGGLHTSGNFLTSTGTSTASAQHYIKAECAYI